ncbi:MAG: transketolase [Microgenomates group bacterium]|jgi:transketolase
MLFATEFAELEQKALQIRQDIIKMLVSAGSGHSAGPLGLSDIFAALYFKILKVDSKKPDWIDRDRLVLSCGHYCPVLYATLARAGYFPESELLTLRKFGSGLQGHPHRESLPGLETTSGPLGSGLSESCGMALAGRMDHKDWRVICIMSDGEQDEGNTWEGVMFAAKYKLDNLVALIDRNHIQIDGITEDIMPIDPLTEKYKSFGWEVIEIDGHDFNQIIDAFEKAKTIKNKPTVIIAKTIPGKGVSFMEGKFEWHGKAPTKEEGEKALHELKS